MTCCAYAAEFDRIYASKKAADTFLNMLFLPTCAQAEQNNPEFHAHLDHINVMWRASLEGE